MAPILNALLPRRIKKGAMKRLEAGNGIVHLPEKEGKTSRRSERAELVHEVRGAHHTLKYASHKEGVLRDRTG